MDGFGVRYADTQAATLVKPVALRVSQTVAAGDTPVARLKAGEAVRIMTGAPIPEGADAVIPIEEVIVREGCCLIAEPVSNQQHIRFSGEDIREGEIAVAAGTRLTPRHVALLASFGGTQVPVRCRPRVAVLATGSELVEVGQSLKTGQIYNSNGPALAAALEEIGIGAPEIAVAADTEGELKKAISLIHGFDVLITVGAVSVGDFDLVPKVLKDLGAEIVFHKVAIKPGKPFLFAIFQNRPIFGLPGNPVSALMVFDRFVRPALLKMMGANETPRATRIAVAAEDLKGSPGKEDYLRGIVEYRDGRYVARSAGSQGSARLVTLAHANAVLVIPEDKKTIAAGETVTFEFLSGVL